MAGDISKVTKSDIIGGYDASTNKAKGLECVKEIYPKYGVIPGVIIAPHWSRLSEVAAALVGKCAGINGCFNTIAAVDISSYTYKHYRDVPAGKATLNFNHKRLIACWPKVALGSKSYYLSTHVAAICAKVAAERDDIPYKSPSNEGLQCDKAWKASGMRERLGLDEATYLNSQGIVTALRFAGQWRLWGNRTSIYPATTDPKDSFISVRRMMDFIGNTLIVSYFSRIDEPITKRLVEHIVDEAQVWLNGLVASGALVGGTIEFLDEDNNEQDLSDGLVRFRVTVCPPSPARNITFKLQYDASLYSSLFS